MLEIFNINGFSIPKTYDTNNDGKLQDTEVSIWCKENGYEYKDGEIVQEQYDLNTNSSDKIDIKQFLPENLKQKFPESKYEHHVTYTSNDDFRLFIRDKQEYNSILYVTHENGQWIINPMTDIDSFSEFMRYFYDESGKLYKTSDANGDHYPLTDNIIDAISSGKDIAKYIKAMPPEDMLAIVMDYKRGSNGFGLISDLNFCWKLNDDQKLIYAKYIVDTVCDNLEQNGHNVDEVRKNLENLIGENSGSIKEPYSINRVLEALSKMYPEYPCRDEDIINSLHAGLKYNTIAFKENFELLSSSSNDVWAQLFSDSDNIEQYADFMTDILVNKSLTIEEKREYLVKIGKNCFDSAKASGCDVSDLEMKFLKELAYNLDNLDDPKMVYGYLQKFLCQAMSRKNKLEGAENKYIKPNGIIDRDFKQGTIGDCWFLASIKAIANSPKGLKILNDSIRVDAYGNTYVTFKGADKTYKITPKELDMNSNLSDGDGDVRAIEIALEKYFEEERGSENTDQLDINGNSMSTAYKILTGNSTIIDEANYVITDDDIRGFNTQNRVVTVSGSADGTHSKPCLCRCWV